jgi:hypothetical protein
VFLAKNQVYQGIALPDNQYLPNNKKDLHLSIRERLYGGIVLDYKSKFHQPKNKRL